MGRLIAAVGAALFYGVRGGVMVAACRGAAGAGGVAGVSLPGDVGEANPFCTVTIPAAPGIARNAVVDSASGAVTQAVSAAGCEVGR